MVDTRRYIAAYPVVHHHEAQVLNLPSNCESSLRANCDGALHPSTSAGVAHPSLLAHLFLFDEAFHLSTNDGHHAKSEVHLSNFDSALPAMTARADFFEVLPAGTCLSLQLPQYSATKEYAH